MHAALAARNSSVGSVLVSCLRRHTYVWYRSKPVLSRTAGSERILGHARKLVLPLPGKHERWRVHTWCHRDFSNADAQLRPATHAAYRLPACTSFSGVQFLKCAVPTQGTTGPEQQHASRVQQVLDMIASLSDAEKTEVWSSSPNARGMPGDFENIVRALLNSVVSLDHLDENDLRVVADSLIDSLSRLCQGVDLHPFVTQAMHRGIEEGRVDATKVVDAVLLHDKLNPLLWKAPSHLNPDEIQRMGRGCPDKIAKCLAINKLMIQRVVELQPTESRKFWVREGAKPIATSSNERDFFFGVVPKLNLQVAKPVVQECVAWIVANVPVQFKKGASDAPEKRKAESAAEGEVRATPVKLPKRVDFDFVHTRLKSLSLTRQRWHVPCQARRFCL